MTAGAKVTAYDPAATERAKEVLPPSASLSYADNLYEAAKDADVVVILTEWKEFASLELDRLRDTLCFPIVVDGRNLYKPQEMLDHAFTYFSVGTGELSPSRKQAAQTCGLDEPNGIWFQPHFNRACSGSLPRLLGCTLSAVRYRMVLPFLGNMATCLCMWSTGRVSLRIVAFVQI